MNPKNTAAMALMLAMNLPAHAQTTRYLQTFNGLPTNDLWQNNLDSAKPSAHPENILVTAECGPDSSNCLRQVYRHFDGIHKQPASDPVFTTDSTGRIIWAPSNASTSNTATDVIQANIMISGSTTGNSSATATPVPSKAYTLSYKVFFEPGFDFAKGGKLPGLAARKFDSGCTEDGSSKRSGANWSVRLMWRANGRVELYSYDQSRPSGSCGINTLIDYVAGEPPYEEPGNIPFGSSKFRFVPNVWYTITLGVKVNDNNAVVYKKDSSGNYVLDGSGDPIPVSANGAEYLRIDGSDGSTTSLLIPNVALRDECNGPCPSTVPDTRDTWVNGLFYSSFFGGNETKRKQCLSTSAPSYPGLTQARYDDLCASQRNPAIYPHLTWEPQTYTAARFDDFKVVEGFPGADTTAPSMPGNVSASPASSSQVNLAWIASRDNVGVVGYRVYRGSALVGSPTGTSFSDTGLSASTSYSYTVKAIDAAGNLSAASATATATTSAASSDTQAPGVPGNLQATAASSSQINLSWSAASDNVAVVGYRVYRGTTLVGSPTSTSFSNTGLSASTAYSYTVKAIDAAGNLSAASNTASATTLGGTGATLTLAPTDDAYIRDGSNASANYGNDTLLVVKTDSAGSNRRSYLKFSLAGLGSTPVSRAVLRVYGSASAATTLTAYQAGDAWTNGGLTWNNAPAIGATAGSVALNATVKYYDIDVTSYVQAQASGDDVATFVLKESVGKYTTFNSANNSANKPQLKIN